MKKYNNVILPILVTVWVSLSSCADQLYSDPIQEVTEKQILEYSKVNLDKILTPYAAGIDGCVRRSISTVVWKTTFKTHLVGFDYMGNDMVHLNNQPASWLIGNYLMQNYRLSNNEIPDQLWRDVYGFVYNANQLLNLVSGVEEGVTEPSVITKLKIYKAIGLTLRAWAYSYLISVYQDDYLHGGKDKAGVPLYLKPNTPEVGRGKADEVWAQIITDASDAVRLFTEGGRNPLESQKDFDATVANMILARAALITGDWNKAISAADAVISTYPALMNETDYTTKGFGWVDVDEIVLGFDFNETSGGTASYNGWMNAFGNGSYGGSQLNSAAIDSRLYHKMDDNDYRKMNFLADDSLHTYAGAASPRRLPKYCNTKFDAPAHPGQANYIQGEIFMRASEAILIKAEAQARSNQEAAAKTTLNTLLAARTKTGETPLTCDTYASMAGLSALEMVQLQTRIELWGEGFEFFNNKRWNIPVNRQSPTSENHSSQLQRDVQPNMTLQLPDVELQYNQYITTADQNP